MMSDPQFDQWRTILEIAKSHKTKGPFRQALIAAGIQINEENPIPGFYRKKRETGEIDPVGIWNRDGVLLVFWGKEPVSFIHQVWPTCIWQPVSREWYLDKLAGKEWPDVHEYGELLEGDVEAEPGPGHNSGATESELDALKREIAIALAGVGKYKIITSDEQRDKAQTLRAELNRLAGIANKKRDELNAPYKAAIEKNNTEWKKPADAAQAGANEIREAQEEWLTLQREKQREKEAMAEAARREREREQERLALEAQAAVDRGEAPPEPILLPPAPEPERLAPESTFRGGTGRAAHARFVQTITEDDVSDWAAFLGYFVNDKSVRAAALKRANSILKSHGEIPPGCTPREVAKVA
jgi:hypothetical protein